MVDKANQSIFKLNPFHEIPYLVLILLAINITVYIGSRSLLFIILFSGIFLLPQLFIRRMKVIEIDREKKLLTIFYTNYLGYKSKKQIILNDVQVKFKKEAVSRMSTRMVFRLEKNNKKLLKLTESDSGLSESTLAAIVESVTSLSN